MTRYAFALSAALLTVAAVPAAAQRPAGDTPTVPPASSTRGLFLGAHLNSSAVEIDDFTSDWEAGGGLGVQVGYGLTDRAALVAEATGTRLDVAGEPAKLGHFDVSLRYAFTGPTRRFVPYLEAGYGARAFSADDVRWTQDGTASNADLVLWGAGPSLGGGVHYFASPSLAFGLGLKWMGGEFDDVEANDVRVDGLGLDARSNRVNLGLVWYPGR